MRGDKTNDNDGAAQRASRWGELTVLDLDVDDAEVDVEPPCVPFGEALRLI